ncbi:hypothetical protein FB481_102355 [Pseudomonas sp. AG1028]|uniref:Uncharacterized protein n=1 Tax=Pseudomonas straminea TaxID=47882 RepID=A0A1I1T8W3_PSEOC|nr:hypothetical protein FB481_102355 [Pseudomonas sp. AG1028]SFD55059.1 hypothetical protein SAMN05216372_102380 [Pseudomonas straminea]
MIFQPRLGEFGNKVLVAAIVERAMPAIFRAHGALPQWIG